MANFVDNYCNFPTVMRRPMWRVWHNLLIRYDKNTNVNFMNYGYAGLNGDVAPVLDENDEHNRYCIQLYDHVVEQVDLKNKRVAEIGSGRGGGADYIARYYKPLSYTAIDISQGVIGFCNRNYDAPGLTFKVGKAEDIPLKSLSCDALVNVESARCYSDISLFFTEVHRVLKKGGYFLFADMIERDEVESIRKRLKAVGLEIQSEKNITKNVAAGLEKDTQRRQELINANIPGLLQSSFASFAGTKGTKRFNAFRDGTFEYRSFVIRKQ